MNANVINTKDLVYVNSYNANTYFKAQTKADFINIKRQRGDSVYVSGDNIQNSSNVSLVNQTENVEPISLTVEPTENNPNIICFAIPIKLPDGCYKVRVTIPSDGQEQTILESEEILVE